MKSVSERPLNHTQGNLPDAPPVVRRQIWDSGHVLLVSNSNASIVRETPDSPTEVPATPPHATEAPADPPPPGSKKRKRSTAKKIMTDVAEEPTTKRIPRPNVTSAATTGAPHVRPAQRAAPRTLLGSSPGDIQAPVKTFSRSGREVVDEPDRTNLDQIRADLACEMLDDFEGLPGGQTITNLAGSKPMASTAAKQTGNESSDTVDEARASEAGMVGPPPRMAATRNAATDTPAKPSPGSIQKKPDAPAQREKGSDALSAKRTVAGVKMAAPRRRGAVAKKGAKRG